MKKEQLLVILDRAHGENVLGKRSPLFEDKKTQLIEWKYSNEIIKRITAKLKALGILVAYTVQLTENKEPGLSVRANRANVLVANANKKGMKSIFLSIHNNAAGNGAQWMNAYGWSAWTTKGKTISDKLADCLYEAAHELCDPKKIKIREDRSDGDPDYEENFTVLVKTNCAAVLTENFFMDTKAEAEWLLSEEGMNMVTDIHVNGILKYIERI